MNRLCGLFLIALLAFGAVMPLMAQGEATVLFLMINPGARQGGMGEAGVALADDANAIYWNPAGLAFQYEDEEFDYRGEGTLMHVNWLPQFNLSDLYYDFAAFRWHFESLGTVATSLQFINYGENVQTDDEGRELGRFNSNEMAFTGGYGLRMRDNWSLGVNLKFVYSRLSPVQVSAEQDKGVGATFGLDIGTLYHPNFLPRLSLGANLSNFGPKVTYIDKAQADPIPTNLRVGLAYRLVDSEFNRLIFVYDINRLLVPRNDEDRDKSFVTYLYSTWNDGASQINRLNHSVGIEYVYDDLIALRTGYFHEHEDFGDRQFLTFGGGVRVSILGIDFSYILGSVEDSPLSDTMRFSLSAMF